MMMFVGFLATMLTTPVFAASVPQERAPTAAKARPNVLLIMTDDQGYGDIGLHGNEKLATPNLDAFGRKNAKFAQFYVSPVCAPTRASLMTGRYNYATGVTDVFVPYYSMRRHEKTLADYLGAAGYRTAIFGKWHLGDQEGYRPWERGFSESLVFWGWSINVSVNPPGNGNFDPTLNHNGKPVKLNGYITDILFERAAAFIEKDRDRPFFVYLPTNLIHTPLQVPKDDLDKYLQMGLEPDTAAAYAGVTNIDDNFGRLMKKLDDLGLTENTLVIFLSDNGSCTGSVRKDRYMAGLRGLKGYVYEGGIRVPCFMRFPKAFSGSRRIDRIAAHIDIVPTILDACGLPLPQETAIDGRSLMPLLDSKKVDWPDRTLFFQWHAMQGSDGRPTLYRAFAARNQRYKLVQAHNPGQKVIVDRYRQLVQWQNRGAEQMPQEGFKFELFDIADDPGEQRDISAKYPKVVEQLKTQYEAWFERVTKNLQRRESEQRSSSEPE